MLGCQTCAAIDECAVCKETFTFHQGIYYDESAELCLQCSPFCSHCNRGTAFHCEDCILDQHRVLVGTTCVCDKYNYKEPEIRQVCVKKDVKKCNRGYIKIETTDPSSLPALWPTYFGIYFDFTRIYFKTFINDFFILG